MAGYIKLDTEHAVVDRDKMCIDRSTLLGQQFDAMLKFADSKKDDTEKIMMKQLLAYAEAGIIITTLYPNDEGKEKLKQLINQAINS